MILWFCGLWQGPSAFAEPPTSALATAVGLGVLDASAEPCFGVSKGPRPIPGHGDLGVWSPVAALGAAHGQLSPRTAGRASGRRAPGLWVPVALRCSGRLLRWGVWAQSLLRREPKSRSATSSDSRQPAASPAKGRS